MAREVRISIDDDEVFERMKARKRDLDLSWEEVLHRGLREDLVERGEGHPGSASGAGPTPGANAGQAGSTGPAGSAGTGRHHQEFGPGDERVGVDVSYDPGDSISGMVEEIKGQVHDQVRESLRASMESVEAAGADLEREMDELANAEDAVLRFPDAAGEDPRYEIPLRVRLETSRGGMDVTVVAVREGKSAAGTNRFDRETRRAVNEHLARGGTASLAFEGGSESYEVAPVLEWRHGDDGAPTVTAVDVEEVIFDAE